MLGYTRIKTDENPCDSRPHLAASQLGANTGACKSARSRPPLSVHDGESPESEAQRARSDLEREMISLRELIEDLDLCQLI